MPDWLAALRADLEAELFHKPKVATLATVGPNDTAEARSVVVRHTADGTGAMTFTSDRRSRKDDQVRANPSATLLFWLAGCKRQYRIAGTAAVLPPDDPRRADQWHRGSDSARALFAWPHPGQRRDDSAPFPAAVSADAVMPDHFEVLVLTPTVVETLDLGPTPHLRQRWTPADGGQWSAVTINP